LLVNVGDADEIMMYSPVIEGINRQLEREANQSDEDRIWIFKEVIDHRKRNGKQEVKLRWEDKQETWEPLTNIANSDPITLRDMLRIMISWILLDGNGSVDMPEKR